MGWPLCVCVLSSLLVCCWLWSVGPASLSRRQEVIATTTVQVSVTPARQRAVPRVMLELYSQFRAARRQGSARPRTDVVRGLTPRNSASLATSGVFLQWGASNTRRRRHLLVFDVPAPAPGGGETLEAAELRVHTVLETTSAGDTGGVERLVQVSVLEDTLQLDVPARQLLHREDAWVTFDVTSAVRRRRGVRGTAIRVVVDVAGVEGGQVDMAVGEVDLQPLLLLSYSTVKSPQPGRPRWKRSSDPDDYEEESNHLWDDDSNSPRMTSSSPAANRKLRRTKNMCRRRPLYVDFSEINYDSWIVAPTGYNAFQCAGKCFFPVGEHLSPTKHAIVQTLLHSVAPAKVSRACCVPTRLEPISILYVDDTGVVTYRFNYKDMVVAECGCR